MMVTPLVEDLKSKKEERIKQFVDIKSQIEKINGEILGYNQITSTFSSLNLEEQDLSIRKLGEYKSHLRSLQKEKVTLHSFICFFFRTGPC
ncbi:putative microtubule-associated protein, MAP65/Ase1/PRC1 [Helianthus anomalus]